MLASSRRAVFGATDVVEGKRNSRIRRGSECRDEVVEDYIHSIGSRDLQKTCALAKNVPSYVVLQVLVARAKKAIYAYLRLSLFVRTSYVCCLKVFRRTLFWVIVSRLPECVWLSVLDSSSGA